VEPEAQLDSEMVAEGLDNTEIVAEVTVRSHISRILDKLHLANRVQASLAGGSGGPGRRTPSDINL